MRPLPSPTEPTGPSADTSPRGNIRRSSKDGNLVSNLLLVASTALSATFCYLYLTKPVEPAPVAANAPATVQSASPATAAATKPAAPAVNPPAAPAQTGEAPLLPGGKALPGDAQIAKASTGAPGKIIPAASAEGASPYEETNLRIQHILSATAPEGELGRIVVDVPVLYQSRNLRWSAQEAAKARQLLSELEMYQQKSRALRHEAETLLQRWNSLVQVSVPGKVLRADSPTLPENQTQSSSDPKLQSSDAIRVEPKR